MQQKNKSNFYIGASSLFLFVLWTLLVKVIDVKAIGPNKSEVGFSAINKFFHELTGVNLFLYNLTDWLSLIPLGIVFGFATLGLILVLGGFYIVTFAMYLLFEKVVINYRPTLLNGILEMSYPSSTTLLVLSIMPTAAMQLSSRIKNKNLKFFLIAAITTFTTFMVITRLISGVHWLTDIIGGVVLSLGLVMLYRYIVRLKQ